MSAASAAKPTQSPSRSPTGIARCRLDDTSAAAAPRQDGLWAQAEALEFADTTAEDTSSGETSPIGLSLLHQKRVRQREAALHPVTTGTADDLENQAQVETSPIGKALLDRKRYHVRLRMARERGELPERADCRVAFVSERCFDGRGAPTGARPLP